jgi:hypothetical protein
MLVMYRKSSHTIYITISSLYIMITCVCCTVGSEGSVQSWASSLSLDSQTDEGAAEAAEFMRDFVATLFRDSGMISQSQKARFGQLAQV